MALEFSSTEASPASARPARSLLAGARRVSARERRFFTERLALMLETGNPLHACLATLARQGGGDALGGVLETVSADVSTGVTFARALARHPEAFPPTYVNLVAASEKGGFLPAVLKRVAEMEERNASLRSTILGALFYPAFLLVFSLVVVVFVLVFVFPKFGHMFASIAKQLPASTIFLMWVSDMLRVHWPVVTAVVAAAAFLLYRWYVSDVGAATLDRLKLRMPLVRHLYIDFYIARIMRVMGLSLEHGVGVPDTIHACRELVANGRVRAFLDGIEKDVVEGRGLSDGFVREPFVPMLVRQMVATGEETATLAMVMTRIADYYERELTRSLALMARLVEPAMLLIMGAVVGVLVSSLILPIFRLSHVAH